MDLRSEALGEDRILVTVTGEVDLATAPDLASALDEAVASQRHVVLDLSAVEFIDTSGVRVMLSTRRETTERGLDLIVVAPSDSPARRILDLTELSEALAVVDSVGDVPAA